MVTKSALFVYGGWEGHEPKLSTDLFAELLRGEGYNVEVSDTLDTYLDTEKLKSLDLIIPAWTMGEITREQEASLLEAVRSGVGVAGWHGTMGDSFRKNTEYQFMVGGQWVAHPGNIIDYTVNIVDHDHPITAGLDDFTMNSEQYYMHVDPAVKILATTTFTDDHAEWIGGVTMPVAWTKYYGKARVAYCSLGHVRADFEVPQAREIVRRCMLWASHEL